MLNDATAAGHKDPQGLRARWAAHKAANTKQRIRDAAAELGVSEAELVATGLGSGTVRLQPRWKDLVEALTPLGRVMALTRNEYCVHEKVGRYDQIHLNEQGGVTLDPEIDLRLFFEHWQHGFAVSETLEQGAERHSLQFFDRDGLAVHKIYLRPESDVAAFHKLVAAFKAEDQSDDMIILPVDPPAADRPDAEIDVAALETRWRAMQDIHNFFHMLRELKVGRTQAFRLVADDLAQPVAKGALSRALEMAAESGLPIMVFVGSPGVVQIHTGPVVNVKRMGPWQNVMDEGFNLHLREDAIDTCWLVRKPTKDGIVTSLEIFDDAGQQIAWMFGKRKPGQPEDPAWRELALKAVAAAG
jgi:putative hemin transport protein